jgi:tyrosine-protein kinase Etk/Wzc
VISVAVRDRDPERAAALANGYVEALRQLTQTLAVTEAGRRRIFFEREVQNTSEDLAKAELALKQTQEKTGMLQLDSQAKAMIDAYMGLRAQVAAKDAEVEAMRSFATPENPDLVRAQHELGALRTELGRFERGQNAGSVADVPLANVPGAGLEYLRRLRELKYREALFELLIKQYEVARIDEAKDAAIIQVVDKAVRPEIQLRDWRVRLLIGVAVALVLLLMGVIAMFVLEAIERAKEDSQYAAHLQLFKFYLSAKGKAGDVVGSGERP